MRLKAHVQSRFGMLSRFAVICLAGAALWALTTGIRGTQAPPAGGGGTALAQSPTQNPCNPCNPGARAATNPCNPCNPGARAATNPCNPCNPGARAATNPCNPCNPDARAATNPCNPCNPCNPGARAATNPCNPCNPCNPGAAAAASNPCNPCNPGAAGGANLRGNGQKLSWGRDFNTWESVSGFVLSNSHGNRLVRTYVDPPEAARVYEHNAELLRQRRTKGYQSFPPGTRIAQESWLRNEAGGPGEPGPMFFMRKDAGGGQWEYGFTGSDLALIAEGQAGKLGFCKECHDRVDGRDSVYAVAR